MPDDLTPPSRRSVRLEGYDYRLPGAYFVTICAVGRVARATRMAAEHQRDAMPSGGLLRTHQPFGEVRDGAIMLSPAGVAVDACWRDIPRHFAGVELDVYVVMPDHMHGIIVIVGDAFGKEVAPAGQGVAPDVSALPAAGTTAGSIPAIVQNFKSVSSRQINLLLRTPGAAVWQRNYYEHVIRNEGELDRARRYIAENPMKRLLMS
jgi:putative transposase